MEANPNNPLPIPTPLMLPKRSGEIFPQYTQMRVPVTRIKKHNAMVVTIINRSKSWAVHRFTMTFSFIGTIILCPIIFRSHSVQRKTIIVDCGLCFVDRDRKPSQVLQSPCDKIDKLVTIWLNIKRLHSGLGRGRCCRRRGGSSASPRISVCRFCNQFWYCEDKGLARVTHVDLSCRAVG